MKKINLKFTFVIFVVLFLCIAAGDYYMQKQVEMIVSQPNGPTELTVQPVKSTKQIKNNVPSNQKAPLKKKRKLVPNHPSEYGIVMREFPKNGTVESWESYYAHEHDYNVSQDPKILEAYKKFQKSPQEVQAILDRYDRKIEKYRSILQANPNDEDAKDRLQTMIRTRAFTKVISDKFNEIPYKDRKQD